MPNLDGLKKLRRGFTLCLTLVMGALTAVSAASQTETEDEEDKNLVGTAVVLRTLDKVTATTKDYTVKIGDTLEYGSLSITARHCEKRPPTEIPETYAFLQITDVRLNGEGDVVDASREDDEENMIFSGWMYASKPAVSALDHRVYDVWVIECQVPESAMEDSLRR